MTTRNAFFDSVGGDRVYTSDTFAQIFSAANLDGVIPFQGFDLAVIQNSPTGMSVQVRTGAAWVQGRYFEVYSSNEVLTLSASHPTWARYDRVVIRLDKTNRTVGLAVVAGTAAASPTLPSLTQTGTIWEIPLAQINVAANATTILTASIFQDAFYSTGKGLATLSKTGVLSNPVDMQQVYLKQLRTTLVWDGDALQWSQITVPAWSGAFPSTTYAFVGFRVWRSDRNLEYYWDGTRWLTCQKFPVPLGQLPNITSNALSANNSAVLFGGHPDNVSDVYIVDIVSSGIVVTTNNGSNYWIITYTFRTAGAGTGASYTANTSANTAGQIGPITATVGAVVTKANYIDVVAGMSKFGSPGNLSFDPAIVNCRLVG